MPIFWSASERTDRRRSKRIDKQAACIEEISGCIDVACAVETAVDNLKMAFRNIGHNFIAIRICAIEHKRHAVPAQIFIDVIYRLCRSHQAQGCSQRIVFYSAAAQQRDRADAALYAGMPGKNSGWWSL